MSDFLCGEMLELDEVDGRNIYFKAKQWDKPLFNSMTLSDYAANDTRTAILQLAFITGEQSDGRFMATVSADIPTWIAGDRVMLKVGSSIDIYPTLVASKAAAAGDGSDRILVGYSDTNNNPTWNEQLGGGSTAVGIFGILPDRLVAFSSKYASNIAFVGYSGNMNAVTGNWTLENFSVKPFLGTSLTSYGRGITFYLIAGQDPSGNCTVNRVTMEGCYVGFQAASLTIGAGKITLNYCQAVACDIGIGFLTNNQQSANNCNAEHCVVGFDNQAGINHVYKNCLGVNCGTVFRNAGAATITTSVSSDGTGGTQKAVNTLGTWNTESATGRPSIYWPSDTNSYLDSAGTDGSYGYDIHGQTVANGSTPIGASTPFSFVNPDYVTEAGGGLYHETSTDEVEAGVMFGPDSTYEGTYATTVSTDPGEANVLKDVTYTINDVPKVGSFDEAQRNTNPGVANVIKDVIYKILGITYTGEYGEVPVPATAGYVRSDFGQDFLDIDQAFIIEDMTVTVAYKRGTATISNLPVILGPVVTEYDDRTGVDVAIGDGSFWIIPDNLDFGDGPFEPAMHDKITDAKGNQWDVIAPGTLDPERCMILVPVIRVQYVPSPS